MRSVLITKQRTNVPTEKLRKKLRERGTPSKWRTRSILLQEGSSQLAVNRVGVARKGSIKGVMVDETN